jgi:predicted phage terminase large subunit-like protein
MATDQQLQTATPKTRRRFVAMSPKQRQFHQCDSWITGLCTGIGFGKTRAGATSVMLSIEQPGESWLAVSPSYVMLRKTTWPLFKKVAKELDIWDHGVLSPFPTAYIHRKNWPVGETAEVMFASATDPESIRGSNNDGLWLDECSIMPEEAFLISIGRLRGIRGQTGPVKMTFTPKGRRHWTFRTFYEQVEPPKDELEAMFIKEINGQWYKLRPKAQLFQAGTWENPFVSRDFYENLKGRYTTTFAEQELAGNFVDVQGLMFQREWFKIVQAAPRDAFRVRYWDLAASDDGKCRTVGTLGAMPPDKTCYIENVISCKLSPFDRDKLIEQTAMKDKAKYNNEVVVFIEQEPGSGGKYQAQQMIRMLAGVPIYRDLPHGGQKVKRIDGESMPGQAKITAAQPFAAQAQAGNVFLVSGEWLWSWLDILAAFPHSAEMDEVDSVSGMYNQLCVHYVSDPGEIITIAPAGSAADRFGVAIQRGQGRR